MLFWRKKQARRRRRDKRNLSWEELNAKDARRVVLETSKKDVKFREFFVYSLAGTLEPLALLRRRQRAMIEEEKVKEQLARLKTASGGAVLDQIMASEESLDLFAEIELMNYRKSRQAGLAQESTGKECSETEVADQKGAQHGFNLTALLQNPVVKDVLGIIAIALLVWLLRFVVERLALAQNQSTTGAVEKRYVVLVDGKLEPVTETQYREWEAQGKLVPVETPQLPPAPASETGPPPEAPPQTP